jgi:hypothetical protein
MPSAAMPQPRPRRRKREILPAIGHHAWLIQICFAGALAVWFTLSLLNGSARDFSRSVFDTDPDVDPSVFVTIGFFVVIVTSVWLSVRQHKHDRSLCERCIALTPLDPERAVQNKARSLRRYHRLLEPVPLVFSVRAAILQIVARVVICLVMLAVLGWWLFWGLPNNAMAYVVVYAMVLFLGVLSPYLTEIHRRLYPWCPFCKSTGGGWEDGGDPEPSPTPVPTAEKSLQ